MSDAEVLFENRGNIGLITFNRPKALNSLTHNMCVLITKKLREWAISPSVQAVVVTGTGDKAFCAGGDVVRVSQSFKDGSKEWRDFFHDEYVMNVLIDEFPKPYISLVDGITMGGGVGVSIPGDFWVATEKTLFAMPETGLGLFPDVGGGWFLPRLPGESGMYLALTGARAKAADLYALGIASHVTGSDKVEAIIDRLATSEIANNDDVDAILKGFHTDPEPAPIVPVMDMIDDHFDAIKLDDILLSLANDESEWAQKQLSILQSKSPMSLLITFEQLKRGTTAERFRDNMQMEFRVVCRAMEGNDFHEGVRAILVEKDHTPNWVPSSLSEISDSDVERHFKAFAIAGEELNLS